MSTYSIEPNVNMLSTRLTIQALAYMSADAIIKQYRKSPGPLVRA